MKRLIILALANMFGATSIAANAANAGRDESQIMASRRQHHALLAQRAAEQSAQRAIGEDTRVVIVGRDRVRVRQSI